MFFLNLVPFSQNITFLGCNIFSRLLPHPVNLILSVVIQIFKIHIINEAFFSFLQPLPWKVRKSIFPVFLVQTMKHIP